MKSKFPAYFMLWIGITTIALAGLFPNSRAAANWQEKVDPWVHETAAQGSTEFLVYLVDQTDLSAAARLSNKLDKGAFVYRTLSEHARRTQGPVIAALQKLGVMYRPY
jgi:hypothetical protein